MSILVSLVNVNSIVIFSIFVYFSVLFLGFALYIFIQCSYFCLGSGQWELQYLILVRVRLGLSLFLNLLFVPCWFHFLSFCVVTLLKLSILLSILMYIFLFGLVQVVVFSCFMSSVLFHRCGSFLCFPLHVLSACVLLDCDW